MSATFLRIAGIGLNAVGALVLAWRVKGVLDALVVAQHANDLNFRLIIKFLNKEKQNFPMVVGMNDKVEKEQKIGIWLLVIGFLCIGVGNILVGLSWYLEP